MKKQILFRKIMVIGENFTTEEKEIMAKKIPDDVFFRHFRKDDYEESFQYARRADLVVLKSLCPECAKEIIAAWQYPTYFLIISTEAVALGGNNIETLESLLVWKPKRFLSQLT